MIDINFSSAISISAFVSIYMIIFMVLTKRNFVISALPIWILLFIITIMCARMICPVEFLTFSRPINSSNVMPLLEKFFNRKVLNLLILQWLEIVWVLGIFVAILIYICKYRIFLKFFHKMPYSQDERTLTMVENIRKMCNFKFNVNVISNSQVDFPAEYGFFNKVIIVDSERYSDEELYYILFHELTHFHIKTNWIKLAVAIIKCTFWWNPVVYLLENYFDNLLEIYVDRFIAENESTLEYMQCLAQVLKKSYVSYDLRFARPMVAKDNSILNRLKLIAKGRRNSKLISTVLLAVFAVFIVLSSRFVIQPAYEPTSEDLTSFQTDGTDSYILKQDGLYYLCINGEIVAVYENEEDFADMGFDIIEE